MSKQDRAPPPLRKILDLDVKLTNNVVTYAYSNYPQLAGETWKSVFKMLEISCHGIPWLAISLISIYMVRSTHNVSVNLLLALLYDILAVGLIKAVTRRPRPQLTKLTPNTKIFFAHGPDKFSFPSGHATRAVLLTLFFNHVTGSSFLTTLIGIWAAVICCSRVIMRRHHVLDVACGVVIGGLEWGVVYYLWAGDGVTSWVGGSVFGGLEDEYDGA